jgi:hypothetical protein
MNRNVALSVLIAGFAGAGAALAGHLAAKKTWQKIFFWGTGLLIVILVCIQTKLNEDTQNHLQEQLETQLNQIQKNTEHTSSVEFTQEKEITFKHDLKTKTSETRSCQMAMAFRPRLSACSISSRYGSQALLLATVYANFPFHTTPPRTPRKLGVWLSI